MTRFVSGLLLSTVVFAATIADDQIAELVERIQRLAALEAPALRADTLHRAADLLEPVLPAKAAEFRRVTGPAPPFSMPGLHESMEHALQTGEAELIERTAAKTLEAIEHSKESPDDYAWFADLRRRHNLVAGGDNPSVRAREALAELAALVNTDFDFRLQDLDGVPVTLKQFRGRTVLLAFWATWCTPCIEELPLLQQFNRERITVLAITDEARPRVREFMQGREPLRVLIDPSRTVFDHFHIDALPAAVILDRTGRIRATITGAHLPAARAILGKLAYPQ